MSEEHTPPRMPPEPCCPGCPGWAVFDFGGGLEIERCDDCWHDVPDAPLDDYFQAHPVCVEALRLAKLA